MKILKRIFSVFCFIAIASTVFVVLVKLFDVDKTAELKPSGNLGTEQSDDNSKKPNNNASGNSENNYTLNNGSTISLAEDTAVALSSQIDVEALLNKVLPSVVSIDATIPTSNMFGQTYESTSSGSGILLYGEEDCIYVVTNNHVVENATSISLTLSDGTSVDATLKGTDSVADLAILAIDPSDLSDETVTNLQYATPVSEDGMEVGDMVLAIGNPLGQGISVTVGYISALERSVTIDGVDMTLIQTDAAINPGNSGGALINLSGELVGINSAKLAADNIEGMGFAIPVTTAIPILEELKNLEIIPEEERGYLGVYIETITSDMYASFGWPMGVYVRELIAGGAAEGSELLTGDIITGVNGITISTAQQLSERINCYRYGTTVTLTVERLLDSGYETLTIDVTLRKRPEGLE